MIFRVVRLSKVDTKTLARVILLAAHETDWYMLKHCVYIYIYIFYHLIQLSERMHLSEHL